MRRRISLLIVLCALAGCPDAGPTGEVVLRRSIRLGNAPEAEAGVVYWAARVRVTDNARKRIIVDLDAKTVTIVHKAARTYIVRTLDEVMRKLDQQRSLDAANTGKVVLTRTESTERIAGHQTRQYTFTTDRARGAVWVSDEVRPLPVWREWEALIAYLEGGFAGGVGITEAVGELDGYPLRTVLTFGDGEGALAITTQVSEVAGGPPAEDLTSVPTDFQRSTDLPLPR